MKKTCRSELYLKVSYLSYVTKVHNKCNIYFIILPYSIMLCHIERESKNVFSSNILQNS